MRLQGGPVDPSTSGGAAESTSSMCVQPSGPSMCAQFSVQNRKVLKLVHPFFITPLLQFEVSRSIGVSRRPRCCFRPNTIHLRVKTATKAATDLEAATDLHVATGPSQSNGS